MTWTYASRYHITSGEWTISKAFVTGVAHYVVWYGRRNPPLAILDSAGAAQEWVRQQEAMAA